MFKKLECVSIHTKDIEKSVAFYKEMGMKQSWIIERELEEGVVWTLVGLKFPDKNSSALVVSNHPNINFMEVEIFVEDVQQTYESLRENTEIKWIREPFQTESGHVAVMEAPDENVFVLVGR
ncbi:glyoxalase/bleomycin resistance/dioxygenase family protein [Bacillus clarus]|uniref:Glyoxalase/Bleomycin resistance /Dioxygenase superfamily protein n=1 Tax=Bacillus clarus TaxID=2338372 RepID=A0A090YST9_9BACI|nr:VOC family protein [Bacillus clarus]KFN01023.1 glyoxalase/Bleomycin resistance /Dioxygenase superfamily protein [Bacillus clarus]RFT62175.1 glyoxalase/bleomycin resistance/dioxygenase family protein [Bacillus clarus]